ncbi:lathosterol oxidase-like [Xyrauchen texanus]|uniref:lathosterol oxidase-like n=1 Tax=Xyrauchen texanus TaxID=154827 RepID=UPI00224234C4|nr:lathosterol oxidase-like [Xyrauchen texanus]XP_051959742.1 lathosterol oxidase-like [Xyrauchen texanus]
MDLVLNVADYYFFTPYVYPSSWPEDQPLRQIISLMVVTNLGTAILYLGLGALSYFFIFVHKLKQHPQFLEVLYLALYVFVNIWTVSIHDGDYRIPSLFENVINGSAHHTDHHLFFDHNYGQYFTLWDRLGSSYRYPSALMGKGPHDHIKKLMTEGKLNSNGVNRHNNNNNGAHVKKE